MLFPLHLKNFRDFGRYRKKDGTPLRRGVYARSDNPCAVTAEDIAFLKAEGFLTDIDLRRDSELIERPDLLAAEDGFSYHHIVMNQHPYHVFCDVIETKGIADSYYHKLTASAPSLLRIFQLIAAAETGVIFHCESGKDRTGTVAALLLLLLEVADKDIIEDYRLTYDCMYLGGDELVLNDPEMIPTAEVMALFLTYFHRDYPQTEDYFYKIGLTAEEIRRIRQKAAIN